MKNKFLSFLSIIIFLTFFIFTNYLKNDKALNLDYKNKLSVHYIDVGQGESSFLISPNGKTMLIDAGGTINNACFDYLKNLNIKTIDILVITHPHNDHISEVPNIINNFEVKKIYMPKVSHTSKTFENMINTIEAKKITVVEAKANKKIEFDNDIECNIISPNFNNYKNLNNWSVVLHLKYKNNSFLFTGDAEEIAENEIMENTKINFSANVLSVGHHGSVTSTSEEFLKTVNPNYAIISAGKNNKYNHPSEIILERLDKYNVKTFKTFENGTIIIISDGENLSINY